MVAAVVVAVVVAVAVVLVAEAVVVVVAVVLVAVQLGRLLPVESLLLAQPTERRVRAADLAQHSTPRVSRRGASML